MDSKTVARLAEKYPRGLQIAEGKTKRVYTVADQPELVILEAKDDITAGDGTKHDVIAGKAEFATTTTCNVFRLLDRKQVPQAFVEQISPIAFVAQNCRMLPYEVVVRREANGSYLKRHPKVEKGEVFDQPLVEFFLKTRNKRWKEHELICDDPLMELSPDIDQIHLYHPAVPLREQGKPFYTLASSKVFHRKDEQKYFSMMEVNAAWTFMIVEIAWRMENAKLIDFKVEFGVNSVGRLLLADVIDNDSWRVVEDGSHLDKQRYRDGASLGDVEAKYRRVAEITSRF